MSDTSLSEHIVATVQAALREDIGDGDLTAALVPRKQAARAVIIARESAIICGQAWAEEVFKQIGDEIKLTWQVPEGGEAIADQVICELRGPARPLLTGERTALNFLQLLSGTATAAHRAAAAVADTAVSILDTRKTIPGLRLAQKYAVRCGGAKNHRMGLFDAILIKENHIVAAGGIQPAVHAALEQSASVLIQVEVETLDQVREALVSGAQRLLLDNFDLEQLKKAVQLREELNAGVTLEASGGITRDRLDEVAATGIDFISSGALTKHLRAIDLSMRFKFD